MLFAHYTAISMSGYKTLVDGEAVEFDIEQSNKGLQAKNIRRLQPADDYTKNIMFQSFEPSGLQLT